MRNLKTLFALLIISLVFLSCNTNENIYDDDLINENFSGKTKTSKKSSDLTLNSSSIPPPPPPGLVDVDIITSPRDGDSFITGADTIDVLLLWDESKITSNSVIVREYKLNGLNPPTLLSSYVTPNDGDAGRSRFQLGGNYRYEIYDSSNVFKDSANFSVDED